MVALLVRTRMSAGLGAALASAYALVVLVGLVERYAVWPHADLSVFSAVALPGFCVAIILVFAVSRVQDWERAAQPIPHAVTLAAVMLLCSLAVILSIAARGPASSVGEFTDADLTRNYAIYLTLGLIVGLWDAWYWAPPLVAMTTVVALGAFGITRSMIPFGPLVLSSGGWRLAGYAAGGSVLVGACRLALDRRIA